MYSTTIMRLDDVAWIYKHTFTQKLYFIPIWKSHSARVYGGSGTRAVVETKQKHVDRLLQTLAARAPWAVGGYSKEMEKAWKKDRAAFLASVRDRRAGVRARAGT